MTLNWGDSFEETEEILWEAPGGGKATLAEYQSNVADAFAQMGSIYTDTGDIPSTATVRESGVFTNPYDAMKYLESGGLVASDSSGEVVPIGFVYLYEYYDELLQQTVYKVYIDEET